MKCLLPTAALMTVMTLCQAGAEGHPDPAPAQVRAERAAEDLPDGRVPRPIGAAAEVLLALATVVGVPVLVAAAARASLAAANSSTRD
ncbi:MAG: hypothetical protein AB1505_16195 [Candidatus Latescibacterota bacterium]